MDIGPLDPVIRPQESDTVRRVERDAEAQEFGHRSRPDADRRGRRRQPDEDARVEISAEYLADASEGPAALPGPEEDPAPPPTVLDIQA